MLFYCIYYLEYIIKALSKIKLSYLLNLARQSSYHLLADIYQHYGTKQGFLYFGPLFESRIQSSLFMVTLKNKSRWCEFSKKMCVFIILFIFKWILAISAVKQPFILQNEDFRWFCFLSIILAWYVRLVITLLHSSRQKLKSLACGSMERQSESIRAEKN